MPDLFPAQRCPHCGQRLPKIWIPVEEIAIVYNTVGDAKEWPLSTARVADLQAAFPHLDILAHCRQAWAWLSANPAKRKTARGMPRFLFNWLSRANDAGSRDGAAPIRKTYDDPRPVVPGMTPQMALEQRERLRKEAQQPRVPIAETKAALDRLRAQVANGMRPPVDP